MWSSSIFWQRKSASSSWASNPTSHWLTEFSIDWWKSSRRESLIPLTSAFSHKFRWQISSTGLKIISLSMAWRSRNPRQIMAECEKDDTAFGGDGQEEGIRLPTDYFCCVSKDLSGKVWSRGNRGWLAHQGSSLELRNWPFNHFLSHLKVDFI